MTSSPLTITYAALSPRVELEQHAHSSAPHEIAIAHTHEEERIGTAIWCMTTCGREGGLAGLYEIWQGERYRGLYVLLLPERRFMPYQAWMEYAGLSSEPQEALDEMRQIEALKERYLMCVVQRKGSADLMSAFQIYAQRGSWKEGQYERNPYPYPSFVDAVRAMGRAHPGRVLVPHHIENLSGVPYAGYIDLHCRIRPCRGKEEILRHIPVGDVRWVGSHHGVAHLRCFTDDDPASLLNPCLVALREQWGDGEIWVPTEEWQEKERKGGSLEPIDLGDMVGFGFPTLDFVVCLKCVQACPYILQEAVEASTGRRYPRTFWGVAADCFAISKNDPVVHLLRCELQECDQPLWEAEDGRNE